MNNEVIILKRNKKRQKQIVLDVKIQAKYWRNISVESL